MNTPFEWIRQAHHERRFLFSTDRPEPVEGFDRLILLAVYLKIKVFQINAFS